MADDIHLPAPLIRLFQINKEFRIGLPVCHEISAGNIGQISQNHQFSSLLHDIAFQNLFSMLGKFPHIHGKDQNPLIQRVTFQLKAFDLLPKIAHPSDGSHIVIPKINKNHFVIFLLMQHMVGQIYQFFVLFEFHRQNHPAGKFHQVRSVYTFHTPLTDDSKGLFIHSLCHQNFHRIPTVDFGIFPHVNHMKISLQFMILRMHHIIFQQFLPYHTAVLFCKCLMLRSLLIITQTSGMYIHL